MTTPDGSFSELRVHGVAATPAASILGLAARPTDPQPDACGNRLPDAQVQIYDAAPVARGVRAFSWSSLTSGSARTALWLLLLPYMLANVAGWAMLPLERCRATEPPPDPLPARPHVVCWVALFVRLAGMLVTAIYVVGLLLIVVDLVGYQWGARLHDYRFGPAAGIAATGLVLGLLFYRTRVRPRPDAPDPWTEDFEDPVGYAWLDRGQDEMWNSPGIIARLHRLHLGFAFGLAALLAMWALHETSIAWGPEDTALKLYAAAATLLPVVLVILVSLSDGRDLRGITRWTRRVAPLAGIAAAAAVAIRFATIDFREAGVLSLRVFRIAGVPLAVTLLVLVAAAVIVAWAGRDRAEQRTPRLSSCNLPALLLTGATVAAIFVVGLATQVARLLGERECRRELVEGCKPDVGFLIDWVSVGFTLMLSVLVVALAVRFALAWKATEAGPQRMMRIVSRVTENVSVILAMLAGIGAAGVVVTIVVGAPGGFGPVDLPLWASAPSVVVLVGAVGLAALVFLWKLRWKGLVVAAAVGVWLAAADKPVQVADIALPPPDFRAFAATIAFTIPMGFVVGRLIGGLRNVKTRETVAIAWDLGNFWPRWFHPLAPPTYADVAVTALKKAMDDRLKKGETVLLAPHSQGTIISAASVAGSDAPTERLAYLTYGSPLSRLYAQVFPGVFTRELFAQICARLTTGGAIRWRNLYRPTDPIGAPVVAIPPGIPARLRDATRPIDVEVDATCGQTHSDYPQEPKYDIARAELLEMTGPPAVPPA